MQRVIALFCVFLLIVFVVPASAGIVPASLDRRLEYSKVVLQDWQHLSDLNSGFIPLDFSGGFLSDLLSVGKAIVNVLYSIYYLVSTPFVDLAIIIELVGVWLSGYIFNLHEVNVEV